MKTASQSDFKVLNVSIDNETHTNPNIPAKISSFFLLVG